MRYFKATDGKVTVFRGSAMQVFRAANFRTEMLTKGWSPIGEISFSLVRAGGNRPAVEISAAEYEALQAAKRARIARDYGAADVSKSNSPQSSWVRNKELETAS